MISSDPAVDGPADVFARLKPAETEEDYCIDIGDS
jgi:hypothetical protein